MRFLTALAALKNGRTLLDGSERMRQRPMARLLDGLVALGVNAYSQEGDGLSARDRRVPRANGGRGPDRWRGEQPVPLRPVNGRPPGSGRRADRGGGSSGFQALCGHHAGCDVGFWRRGSVYRGSFFFVPCRATIPPAENIPSKGMPPMPPISLPPPPLPGEGEG